MRHKKTPEQEPGGPFPEEVPIIASEEDFDEFNRQIRLGILRQYESARQAPRRRLTLRTATATEFAKDRPVRLGRIERFLLSYALRQHKRTGDFVSRSSALQKFVEEDTGGRYRSYRQDWKAYGRSVQVKFTKALKQLRQKGLIETYTGPTGSVVDAQGDVIPIEIYDMAAARLGLSSTYRNVPPEWSILWGRRGGNGVSYRLTANGRKALINDAKS